MSFVARVEQCTYVTVYTYHVNHVIRVHSHVLLLLCVGLSPTDPAQKQILQTFFVTSPTSSSLVGIQAGYHL